MAKKNDLGKGLRALISNIEDKGAPKTNSNSSGELTGGIAKMLPVSAIEANPEQPRKEFDAQQLEELSQSIAVHGLIQPITVRKFSQNSYQIISGERRFRASKLAGLTELPAFIREANDQELVEMALIENIQRSDLNPLEIAFCYERLMTEFDLTHEALGKRVGKERSSISNFLRLIKLPPGIQKAVKENKISLGHAKLLAGVHNDTHQLIALNKIIDLGLSVRATETLIKSFSDTPNSRKKSNAGSGNKDPHLRKVEDNLSNQLGSRVTINLKKNKGQISIPFNSVDHLNDILENMKYES